MLLNSVEKFFHLVLFAKMGNVEFADYVDRTLDAVRIVNRNDIISDTPPFPPYTQIAGEIRIQENGDWVACPGSYRKTMSSFHRAHQFCTTGRDNRDPRCAVRSFLDANVNNHLGPFNGVILGCDRGLPIIQA